MSIEKGSWGWEGGTWSVFLMKDVDPNYPPPEHPIHRAMRILVPHEYIAPMRHFNLHWHSFPLISTTTLQMSNRMPDWPTCWNIEKWCQVQGWNLRRHDTNRLDMTRLKSFDLPSRSRRPTNQASFQHGHPGWVSHSALPRHCCWGEVMQYLPMTPKASPSVEGTWGWLCCCPDYRRQAQLSSSIWRVWFNHEPRSAQGMFLYRTKGKDLSQLTWRPFARVMEAFHLATLVP